VYNIQLIFKMHGATLKIK